MSIGGDRAGMKWDRAARYLRIAMVLHAHPEGLGAGAIAERVGVSRRTIYRDLDAMSIDAGLPLWQEGGRWGLEAGAFLPPLALTLHEAMALFLAARMLAKTSDEQDTELIGAFVKLASILPDVLAAHVRATVDAFASTPRDDRFTRVFRTLTEAWAQRRVVSIRYDAGVYDPGREPRVTRVRPWLIEPSALTHALYLIGFDEERGARRTFKVERILEATLTPETFEMPSDDGAGPPAVAGAWDVITDQPLTEVVARFGTGVAKRVAETRWHPSQTLRSLPDGTLEWRGRVAGTREIRIWLLGWGADVEVLAPPELRSEVADEVRRAAEQYGAR